MRKCKCLWAILLLLPGAFGCNKHMEYDTSKGVDSKVTLFEKEVIVPVGSAGPFGVSLVMGSINSFMSNLGLPEDVLSADDNGTLQIKFNNSFSETSMYKLAIEEGNHDEPYKWIPDETIVTPTFSGMATFLKIKLQNQEFEVTARAPFRESVTIEGNIVLKAMDQSYMPVKEKKVELPGEALLPSGRETHIASFKTDESWADYYSQIILEDFFVTLPPHFAQKVNNDGIFVMNLLHKANFSLGENFQLGLHPDFKIPVRLPFADLGISDATVSLTLENTIPLAINVSSIKVLGKKEDGSTGVIENLEVSPDIKLAGGSPAAPASSNISIRVRSLDGTPIPDIETLSLALDMTSAPGSSDVLLSTKQGVSIKSSSIKIRGGVTLFDKKEK